MKCNLYLLVATEYKEHLFFNIYLRHNFQIIDLYSCALCVEQLYTRAKHPNENPPMDL